MRLIGNKGGCLSGSPQGEITMKTDYKNEAKKVVDFIKKVFKDKGFSKAVIGVSGGIDSAVVTTLLVKALGAKKVFGYSLPYGEQIDINDAKLVAVKNKINYETIDILPIVNAYANGNISGQSSTMRLANLKARVRMIALYDQSYKNNALVVGTGNKTELVLGYFTHHGDGACALEPIGHLYKTEVKELAKEIGVPKRIIDKPPSAGLWEGQTDEKELGTTYEQIDKILEFLEINKISSKETYDEFFEAENNKMYELLMKMEQNKFKLKPPLSLGG